VPEQPVRIAAVSFLNAKPLTHHLLDKPGVQLTFDVPAKLADLLAAGHADVALLPVVDLADLGSDVTLVSDACIGSDGPTLTVQVFARREPASVNVLYADVDSHTSVVLARLLWREMFGQTLDVRPCESIDSLDDAEAVLLIGDKVVTNRLEDWPHQIDLGQAWKQRTGLPFVFAVWAGRAAVVHEDLARLLAEARDAGCAQAARLAALYGPQAGWPVDLAETYLTRNIRYRLDEAAKRGLRRFLEVAADAGLLSHPAEALSWMPR